MKNSKYVSTLQALNKETLQKLGDFISSPYFNKNNNYLKFYEFTLEYHPNFSSSKCSNENAFHAVFPNEKYNHQKFKLLMSDTYKLIKKFLAYHEIDPFILELNGLKNYRGVNLEKSYLNKSDTLDKIHKNGFFDTKTSIHSFLLEKEIYTFNIEQKERNTANSLINLLNAIDDHFLYSRLKYTAEALNRMNTLSIQSQDLNMDEVLSYYTINRKTATLPTTIFYYLVMLLKENRSEIFQKSKQIILKHIHQIEKEELRDMFICLQNFCIKQINTGNEAYLKELLELFKIQLKHQTIIINKKISIADFKNIATVGLRLSEIEWVKEFTYSYVTHLPKLHQESAQAYNLARVYFQLKEYKQSLKQLLHVEYSDIYFTLGSKSLLIKIYYELNDFEALENQINSFKVFLVRDKKVSNYQKTIYKNFIRITKKLFDALEGKRKQLSIAKAILKDTGEIADLTWINQKIKELEKA